MGDSPQDIEKVKLRIERYKVVMDYLKHLTTLSTWSILLIAGFVERVFPQAEWKPLTAVALMAFMLAILGCVSCHTMGITRFPPQTTPRSKFETVIGVLGVLFAWCGFVVGIVSMAIFATKNLL